MLSNSACLGSKMRKSISAESLANLAAHHDARPAPKRGRPHADPPPAVAVVPQPAAPSGDPGGAQRAVAGSPGRFGLTRLSMETQHSSARKQRRGADGGGLSWPLEVQRKAMGGVAALMLAGSAAGDAAMDPEIGAMLSSGHTDLLAAKVCVLPDDAERKPATSPGGDGQSPNLPRQSSLGQLHLDVLPNHNLVEFFKHRDSREAKEASCLASSSFEEESRSPATRVVESQQAQAGRAARAAAAEIDFRLERDIQLQASSELGENLLSARPGGRRFQQGNNSRGRVMLRSRSRRGIPRPTAGPGELLGAETDDNEHPLRRGSTASPTMLSGLGSEVASSLRGTRDSLVRPATALHKMARTRSALV